MVTAVVLCSPVCGEFCTWGSGEGRCIEWEALCCPASRKVVQEKQEKSLAPHRALSTCFLEWVRQVL